MVATRDACGSERTFTSEVGHFWAHDPCVGVTDIAHPAHPALAADASSGAASSSSSTSSSSGGSSSSSSSSSSGGGGSSSSSSSSSSGGGSSSSGGGGGGGSAAPSSSWEPQKWLTKANAPECARETRDANIDCTVWFRPPRSVWSASFERGEPQPWYADFRRFQAQLRRTAYPADCAAVRWAGLRVASTYGITANFLEHVFLDLSPVLLNGTTPVITGGDDKWAEADTGMACDTMLGCYLQRFGGCTSATVARQHEVGTYHPQAPFEGLYGDGIPQEQTAWRAVFDKQRWLENRWGGLPYEAALVDLNFRWAPAFEALMKKRLARIGLLAKGPCVAVHVRRGDMQGMDAYGLKRYIDHAVALARRYGLKSVFLLTDNASVATRAQELAGGLPVLYSNSNRDMYDGTRVESLAHVPSTILTDLFTDLYAASHCAAMVGNVERTHVSRMVLDLITIRAKAVPPFASLDKFGRAQVCRGCWEAPCIDRVGCHQGGWQDVLLNGRKK